MGGGGRPRLNKHTTQEQLLSVTAMFGDECPPQAKNLENQMYLRGRPNQHDIDTGLYHKTSHLLLINI